MLVTRALTGTTQAQLGVSDPELLRLRQDFESALWQAGSPGRLFRNAPVVNEPPAIMDEWIRYMSQSPTYEGHRVYELNLGGYAVVIAVAKDKTSPQSQPRFTYGLFLWSGEYVGTRQPNGQWD